MKKVLHLVYVNLILLMLIFFYNNNNVDLHVVKGQEVSTRDKFFAKQILNVVGRDIIDLYYNHDLLKSINIKNKLIEAKRQIDEAQSINQMYGIIGQLFLDFDEVGTYFMSPIAFRFPEYGFQWDIAGNSCYVTYVAPNSEAARSGMKKGDQILQIHKFVPTRENAWKIRYTYTMIRPITKMPIKLKRIDGEIITVELTTQFINASNNQIKIEEIRDYINSNNQRLPKCFEHFANRELVVIKNTQNASCFQSILDPNSRNMTVSNFNKYKGVILDLRDCCSTDYEFVNAKKLLSYFIDKRTKLADLNSRGKIRSIYIDPVRERAFLGNQIVVLVDSQTRSIGEIIARLMQIEGIARVIGDRTRGNVRLSKYVATDQHRIVTGHSSSLFFLSSITTHDFIFSDNVKIDRLGITPDIVLVPSGRDMLFGRDIVMSYALKLYGLEVSPERAGTIFATTVTNWMYRYL